MKHRMVAMVSVVVLACSSPVSAAEALSLRERVAEGQVRDPAAWLAKVEGFFATQNANTPIGEIPFAMDMVKEADGSVHGRTWADKESYFDFKFYLNEKGQLLFHETGALPGGLLQSHILEVAKVDGDTITFESTKAPGLLVATVTADGKQLHVVSVVRGKPHANLQMQRITVPQAIAAFRESNAKNKEQASNPVTQQVVQTVMQAGLQQAVGVYEMPDPGRTVTITLEGGKLFAQPNGAEKREVKSEGEGVFGAVGAPFKVRFVRDLNGNVTHLQVLINGQEMGRAVKVK